VSDVAVSLYDESGNMLRPWAEAGWTCYNVDIINRERVEHFKGGGSLHWICGDMRDRKLQRHIVRLQPRFIPAFPPCTDLAVSGAKHFERKRQENPRFQEEAMELVYIARDLIVRTKAVGFIENPRSVISTLWRKYDFRFDPCDYGGYLPADDKHPRHPDVIPPRDAYTKDTWIWSVNQFRKPRPKPVKPIIIEYENGVRGSPQFALLGGKSDRVKEIRSETARGFVHAVFADNYAWLSSDRLLAA
jgi:hypothetical protein